MEARRSFDSGAKSSKVWIVVASLLAAMALGLAGGYAAKGTASVSPAHLTSRPAVQSGFQAPDAVDRNAAILRAHGVVQSGFQSPDAQERNAQRNGAAPAVATHKKLTVF
jgi:hypothetical protein